MRPETIEKLQARRAAWAREIGQNNEWSHLAPQFVKEIDEEITRLKAKAD